jgi:hypothetical protein
LKIINQRKDQIESAVLRKDLEEMQNSLMQDGKRAGYQRPPFINPPWKPGGINTSTNKRLKEKTPKSSIPTYSSLKLRNSTLSKSGIPTRQQSSSEKSGTPNNENVAQQSKSNKETK